MQENLINRGKTIEAWSIDMSNVLKSACRQIAPKAPIVSDKYHVISFVNRTIDLCRISAEKRLKKKFQLKRILLMKIAKFKKVERSKNPKWQYKTKYFKQVLREHQEVRVLWDLKNMVHGFYQCQKKESINKAWYNILDFLEKYKTIHHPEFTDLKDTLLNWQEEILNYFTYRITNGYIEGINNRIETLKRKKFGFKNKLRFLKSLNYALLPISMFIANTIFNH